MKLTMNTALIIEDDYAIIRGLKDSFINRGFDVRTAMDGRQALDIALTHDFDIILLDIMLPKINGFEVCKRIRESEIETPIIMLTAKGEEDDIIRGLNLGADDYITKPFSVNQLHARCQVLLRRHKKIDSPTHQFGEYTLNTQSRELHHEINGKVELTPKEYSMLEFFLRRQGHALTRDTLLNAVWHSNILTTSRSVDRCVNTLRKKIELDSRKPKFILSIRDVGYRFCSIEKSD